MTPSQRVFCAVAASLLFHGVAAWVLPEHDVPRPQTDGRSATAEGIEVPFEPMVSPSAALPAALRYPEPPAPGGQTSRSSLDTAESQARGGTGAAPDDSLRLFPFVCSVRLQDTLFNHAGESQLQRIHTSPERNSIETRRATPHADDAVFLATGDFPAGHQERRVPSPVDARHGGPADTRASEQGEGQTASVRTSALHGEADERSITSGARRDQADQGIFAGHGVRASSEAKVAFGRPDVDRGPAATLAVQQGRVQDDTDAELLAALLERSLVDASTQRSQRRGDGLGGDEREHAGFAPTGDGRGAKATPYLPGPGRAGILDTRDGRYLRWFTQQRKRVQERLAFPLERALAKDQGTPLYRIEIRRDGSLLEAPTLIRSSGYPDFDQAARVAIERAAPFDPLPSALAPAQERLSLVIPVAFENPMVQ